MTTSLVLVAVAALAAFSVAWIQKLGVKSSSTKLLWVGAVVCIVTMVGYLLCMKREYYPLTPLNFIISLWAIIYVGIIHSLRIHKKIHEIQKRGSQNF